MLQGFTWLKLATHVLAVAPMASPFVLMLHCVVHRPLFKKEFSRLDGLVHYVLAPFYGHTWNTFYCNSSSSFVLMGGQWIDTALTREIPILTQSADHHVRHHHVENNSPTDLSTTIFYQRDSLLDFSIYFFRFLLLISFELPLYFARKKQFGSAAKVFLSESLSLVACALVYKLSQNGPGTFFVFVLPFLLMRFGMMAGNWAQHAFVDPLEPFNDYRSSITCIETVYNTTCFNDGYHTSHHLNSTRHWQDHPEHLIANKAKFKQETAIIFRGIDFFIVTFYLFKFKEDSLACKKTLEPASIVYR
jgi:hypothetical protein